ncbi:MAG: hypothetical protein QG578_558, partial [Thermodesulfobacteriota bacterium]|nr:hypothetical protein [Thermodesulfobacteriota bacterium]
MNQKPGTSFMNISDLQEKWDLEIGRA